MSRPDVTERLTRSLDAVAGDFSPDIPMFDPQRPPSVVLPEEAAAGRPRPYWRLAAAAVVALVAGIASVVVLHGDDHPAADDDVHTSDTPSRPPAPDGALLPTWLPEGMEAWSAQWWQPTQPPPSGGPAHDQLFMDVGGTRRIKLEIRHGMFPGGDGSGDTVRGQPATVAGGDGPPGELLSIGWLEEGDFITARATGMRLDEVTTFLDRLQRRPSGDLRGFDPPIGSSDLVLVSDVPVPEGERSRAGVTIVYGRGLPREAQPDDRIVVETLAPDGELGLDYVDARFWGTTRPDGTVVVDEDDAGRTWLWPDGRRVSVTPEGEITAADAERVAASVAPATAAELVALRDDAEAWAATAPTVAEATFSSGITVELRGGGDLVVVCARFRSEDGRRCFGWNERMAATPGGSSILLAGFLDDDDRWYAVYAVTTFPAADWKPTSPPADPDTVVPTESATSGEWTIGAYPVPEGVTAVGWGPGPSSTFVQHRDWAR